MVGQRSRNDEEKELRQKQILAAAKLEFNEKGFDKVTMTSIAKRSGLSRGLVNFYFGSKSGVHKALEEQALATLHGLISKKISEVDLGLDKIINISSAFKEFFDNHFAYYESLIRADDDIDIIYDELKKPSTDLTDLVILAIEKGQVDGSIKNPFPNNEMAALSIWSICHGFLTISKNKASILENHWGSSKGELLKCMNEVIRNTFKA